MPSFSKSLESAIHQALSLANERRHELATLEHLLLSLISEPDAAKVMQACSVDLEQLRATLVEFIDEELSTLVTDIEGSEAVPTAAFQRVIQRAAIHVQSSGRTEVTGANVLVAIFAERESNAVFFLQEQEMTGELYGDLCQYLDRWLPRYREGNRSYMTIAIGCTGGQHRSVYLADRLFHQYREQYPAIHIKHRDLQ